MCRLDSRVCGGMQLSGFLCLTQFDFARFFWVSSGMNLGAVDMFERGGWKAALGCGEVELDLRGSNRVNPSKLSRSMVSEVISLVLGPSLAPRSPLAD